MRILRKRFSLLRIFRYMKMHAVSSKQTQLLLFVVVFREFVFCFVSQQKMVKLQQIGMQDFKFA